MDRISYNIEEIGDRKVYIALPGGKSPVKGWPVAILLHGRGQTAGTWFGKGLLARGDQKLFPPMLLKEGIIVVAPEALEPFGKGVRQWDFLHRKPQNSRDLAFFQDLFQWMKGNHNIKIDLSMICVIGISSGGFMASRLAQVYPEYWASLIVIAAGNADSFPKIPSFPLDNEPLSCEISPQHPPVLIIHGEKDKIVPFIYGERYFQDLKKRGIEAEMVAIPNGGHLWPAQFHERMIKWLSSHQKTASFEIANKYKFELDESFNNRTISITSGETFSLSLKGVPTAGYEWKIVEMDKAILKTQEQGRETLTKPGLVGGSALFTWRFQALGKGKTRLVLKHYRSWEGVEKASGSFTLEVEIQ